MSDCIFCRIVRREAKAAVVGETDEWIAFDDIQPQAPLHTLFVPKVHFATMNDLSAEDAPMLGRMVLAARDLARERGLAERGYRLVTNCNREGGQGVYHVHFHLLGGKALGPKLCGT